MAEKVERKCKYCPEDRFEMMADDPKSKGGKANLCKKCKGTRATASRKREREAAAIKIVTIYGTCLCGCGRRTKAKMEKGSRMIPKFAPKCPIMRAENDYERININRRANYAAGSPPTP